MTAATNQMTKTPSPNLIERMQYAAVDLASICSVVDGSQRLEEWLLAAFQRAETDHVRTVTDLKAMGLSIAGQVAAAKQGITDLKGYIAQLEGFEELVKARTLEAIVANPDLPWKDDKGVKISVVQNGGLATLSHPTIEVGQKSVSNIIDEKDRELLKKWTKEVTFTVLDTDKIRAHLATELLPWASLKRGRSVRGLFPSKGA